MKYLTTLIWMACLLSLNSCNDEVCSDLEMRVKFIGIWDGTEICDGDEEEYYYEFTIDPSNSKKLITDDGFYCVIISDDSFEIPEQIIDGDKIMGSGTLTNDVLTMITVIEYDDGTIMQCQFTGTK